MDDYIQNVKTEGQVYHNFENTPFYPKYKELIDTITDAEFVRKKKYLQTRKYKDTDEYKKMAQFKKLASSLAVRFYLYLLQSEKVQSYLRAMKEGKEVDKKLVKSFSVRKFIEYHHSEAVNEYFELKKAVEQPDFKKANDFWANPQRWKLTEEAKVENEFSKLCQTPDVKTYRDANKNRIKHFDSFAPLAESLFHKNAFPDTIWQGGFFYPNDAMKKYHSYPDQLQAFNEGKNISIQDGLLSIQVRKEPSQQVAWHPSKGFILHNYTYTSDIINSGKTIQINKGMVVMKIKSTGNMHHLVTLQNIDRTTNIILFHSIANKVEIGIRTPKSKQIEKISGINPADWHYYFLIWNEKELIWLINNYEVCRIQNNLGNEKFYLQATSFIPKKAEKGVQLDPQGSLDMAFVGVYSVPDFCQKYIYSEK